MNCPRPAASGPHLGALDLALLSSVALLLGCAAGISPSPPAAVANPPAAPQTVTQPAAADLSSHAAVIFRGTVIALEPVPTPPDGVGAMRVRFRVDEGFRGAQTGQLFTLTEWQGLWSSGDRYRVGEPLLLYLYAPASASGLASPVSGYAGLISLAPSSSPPETGGWAASFEPQPPSLDPDHFSLPRNPRQVSPE